MNRRILTGIAGIKDGLPICIGYFPIGMAYGLMAKGAELTVYDTLALSFIVFAGASQFMAVSMIAMGVSSMEIIMTTFFVNFRHLLMSASLAPKIEHKHPILKPLVAFFVTDETFSVASFAKGELTDRYMLSMEIVAYLGWGIGSGVGFIVGSVLPPLLQQSMKIGLYAMFVALLMPEASKSVKVALLAISSGVANTLFVSVLHISAGWSIVFSIILVSGLGVLFSNEEENGDKLKKTMEVR